MFALLVSKNYNNKTANTKIAGLLFCMKQYHVSHKKLRKHMHKQGMHIIENEKGKYSTNIA